MTARIYTGAEARALREDFELNGRGDLTEREPDWNWICSSAESCILFVASPDLAASVEHHAARADAAEQECARLAARVAAVESALRDNASPCCATGCDRMGLWIYGTGVTLCGDCYAIRVVAPERTAGWQPIAHADVLRSLDAPALIVDAAACDAIDGGATAGPQHVDATGREVLP